MFQFKIQYSQIDDQGVNAAIHIINKGWRILSLGTSDTVLGGNLRPKQHGCKSTTAEAFAEKWGGPHLPFE